MTISTQNLTFRNLGKNSFFTPVVSYHCTTDIQIFLGWVYMLKLYYGGMFESAHFTFQCEFVIIEPFDDFLFTSINPLSMMGFVLLVPRFVLLFGSHKHKYV